eukprot:3591111-Alexandrium_andersonii.AAC.1
MEASPTASAPRAERGSRTGRWLTRRWQARSVSSVTHPVAQAGLGHRPAALPGPAGCPWAGQL